VHPLPQILNQEYYRSTVIIVNNKGEDPIMTTECYLKDYTEPPFLVETIDLQVELNEEKALVLACLKMVRNTKGEQDTPLILQGEALKLISLRLNEVPLSSNDYTVTPETLMIQNVPDDFTLEIVTEIYPQKNTALSGLYRSNTMFCTQCEAEGFRRITYYLDRPDVMAIFTTTVVADKTMYPILLSNGNKIDQGEMSDNRHFVKWHDPFKKPCYLFALVAGDLAKISDVFTTLSGRKVALEVFVEPENKDKCQHALDSLKHAMAWDEKTYGREYDLDIYMIVAVNDFTMGAMENKGLNIFNSKYVLVSEKTATDSDYQNVELVIGHEYFHNWTGNRITCRDWFQLSLKEGLTVFREQQFSANQGWPIVKRINDVKMIRTRQFAEDAGPLSHPVRPSSYIEINNFYTATIYNKGAEVIRMLHTLLGEKGFRQGMDLYFQRHDGQAVTIEDFVAAMSDANGRDLTQFYLWYNRAGTPVVIVTEEYDPLLKQYKMHLLQNQDPPFLIPIKMALYDNKGNKLPLETTETLILTKSKQSFTFSNIQTHPTPSLLGHFSAPIKLLYPYTQMQLQLLMIHDEDLFNRWDAAQKLGTQTIKSLMKEVEQKQTMIQASALIETYRLLLNQEIRDPALFAQLLLLPSFQYIAQELSKIPVKALIFARKTLINKFSTQLKAELSEVYLGAHERDDGTLSSESMGQRALKNVCLGYLVRANAEYALAWVKSQYYHAKNMTDKMGALHAINHSQEALRKEILTDFYGNFKHDPLVVNKWFALQSSSELPDTLENIKSLTSHEAFSMKNPNNVYALINTFSSNPEVFHDEKGAGYQFLADCVITLDKINPQVAARVIDGLTPWKHLDTVQGNLMKCALEKVQAVGALSKDITEVVQRSLS